MITPDQRCNAIHDLLEEVTNLVHNPAVLYRVPEIGEHLNYLQARGALLVYPEQGNEEWVLEDLFEGADPPNSEGEPDLRIKIYPMYSADAQCNKMADGFVQRLYYGGYGPHNNILVVSMEAKETKRFLAHVLLHELGHAYLAYQQGIVLSTKSRPIADRVWEEVKLWTVDYRLMLALGDKRYEKRARRMASEIDLWVRGKGKKPDYRAQADALNVCFGVSPSPNYQEERGGCFFYYAGLMAIDKYSSKALAEKRKYALLEKPHTKKYVVEKEINDNLLM